MTNCNKTEKNINFPMPAVHFLTDSAHQRHLLAASNVLQAHLQAMVLLQYFMIISSVSKFTSAIYRAVPRAKSGRNFAIGAGFLFIFFAPTGHGLFVFCPVPRSGFQRGKNTLTRS